MRILARERDQIAGLLARVADGPGRCLVVHGPAGSGKSTLVEEAMAQLDLVDVVRLRGVASERDLPLAGLHQLCRCLAGEADRLPAPQQDALEVALGRRPGQIDRFLVAVAVLGLLTSAAEERPVVCFVDDADRLDDASLEALAFVAHRMSAARVSLVFVVRTRVAELDGLHEVALHPVPTHEARAFVTAAYPGRLLGWARARVVADARGNPAALLALGAEVAADDGAGGFTFSIAAGEATGHDGCRGRLDRLGPEVGRVLLVAAAELDGNPARFWDALEVLGIDAQVADEAATQQLLDFGTRITFPDHQLRGVVYRAASSNARRLAHQALADVCTGDGERPLRAWHLGQTTLAPDDVIADTLEEAVQEARTQTGRIGAAALLARATTLTRDPARRARRALAAAHMAHEGGATEAAGRLLDAESGSVLDERDRARSAQLRAELAWAAGDRDAVAAMLQSAEALSSIDSQLGANGHVAALEAALRAGGLGPAGAVQRAGKAVQRGASVAVGPPELLGAGLVTLETEGFGTAAPTLRRGVDVSRRSDDPHVCAIASRVAEMTWDVEAAHDLLSARLRIARERGAAGHLADVLDELGAVHAHAGDLHRATRAVEEASAFGARAAVVPVFGAMVLAAWRGQEEQTADLIETSRHLAVEHGRGELLTRADYAGAVLANGLGRYETVLAGVPNGRRGDELLPGWLLPEQIEAAARAGEPVLARVLVDRLLERTHASPTVWAQGVEARALALVADPSLVEQLHRDAIRHLGATRLVAQRARAHLLYGEWLRRCRRRLDARAQLRIAHDLFASCGAEAFATRASRELLATGERARRRTVDTAAHLTPREEEIANLARDGESNPQIAGRLFISTRTVEYHLHKVFTKLGITSRAELAWSLEPGARAS